MVKPAGPQEILSYVSPADSINCMVGSIGAGRNSYLITGGNDSQIRFWDFSAPSKCYVLSDRSQVHPQPSFERIDFDGQRRLMLCRQSTKFDRNTFHGLATPEDHHFDAIQDLKIVDHSMLLSCSRDCTVKIWR
jgi:WD40 repeat protein